MNDPITLKYRHNGLLFVFDQYYNPLPMMGSIESPITDEPTMPENPGW